MDDICASGVADPDVRSFLMAHNSAPVARRGELVDTFTLPVLVARDAGGDLAGVLAFEITGTTCEIVSLHCSRPWAGVGTRLLAALTATARARGCRSLEVVTTNDNVDALRFYQRRGFRLAELRAGAVEEARRSLKPTIPATGAHDIPLRDELELSRVL